MKQRIRELAEQAGAGRRAGVGGLVFRDNELEKFAELIVNHAVECVRDVLRDPDSNLSYDDASMIQARIRRFFENERTYD